MQGTELEEALRAILTILRARNYQIPSEGEVHQLLTSINTKDDLELLLLGLKQPDQNNILVKFTEEPRITAETVKNFTQKLQEKQCARGVLIHNGTVASSSKQSVQLQPTIELLSEHELFTIVTTPDLSQCKHKVLTDQEKQDFLGSFQIQESDVPKLPLSEPLARYIGLLPTQMVKLTYHRESRKFVTFRLGV